MTSPLEAVTAAANQVGGTPAPAGVRQMGAKAFADHLSAAKAQASVQNAGKAGGVPASAASSSSKSGSSAASGSAATPVLKPTGEKLTPVAGHHYSKIESGVDTGMYLNQVKGGPRNGEAFRLVERGGKTFHVYGSGKDKLIIEMKPPKSSSGKTGK